MGALYNLSAAVHISKMRGFIKMPCLQKRKYRGPVAQSVVSLTSSLRVISLTVLEDPIHNILIFFAEKNVSSYSHFFSNKFQNISVSLDVNFNESLTNDVVSFEQLGPDVQEEPQSQNIAYQ